MTRKTFSLLAVIAAMAPAAAQAQFTVGARTGYAIPLGDVGGTLKMNDTISGQIPLHLDIGYQLANTNLTVGGYFEYGLGGAAGAAQDDCDAFGQDCSSSTLRIGAQLLYSFVRPQQTVTPWMGVGLGYESFTFDDGTAELTASGTEFLILQGGMDWKLGATAKLGLFASFSLGQYSDIEIAGLSGSIPDKKMHEWFTLGVRGAFGTAR